MERGLGASPAVRGSRWNPRGDGTTVAARTEPATRRTWPSPPCRVHIACAPPLRGRPPRFVILSAAKDLWHDAGYSAVASPVRQIPRCARDDRASASVAQAIEARRAET